MHFGEGLSSVTLHKKVSKRPKANTKICTMKSRKPELLQSFLLLHDPNLRHQCGRATGVKGKGIYVLTEGDFFSPEAWFQ